MDQSTTATIANETQTSEPNKAIILFAFFGLEVFGSAGVVGSALVIVVVFCSKSLRSSCFELIGVGAVGSFLVAVYHVTCGIYICGYALGAFSLERPRWQCALISVAGLVGIPYHTILICFVGFDRLISLIAPIKHRQLGQSYVIATVAVCTTFVTVQTIVALLTVDLNQIALCKTMDDVVSRRFMDVYGSLNIFYYSISVSTYVSIFACCYWRGRHGHQNESEAEMFKQQQSAIIPAVRLMIILYFISGLLGEVLISAFSRLESSQLVYFLWACGINLKVTSSMVEIFSLLMRSTKFRECFRSRLGMKPILVAPQTDQSRMQINYTC